MIVATPARALGQIIFKHLIDYGYRIFHDWIIGVTNAEAHQIKKFSADNITRGMQTAAVRDLYHARIRIGMVIWFVGIRRVDADVMTRFAGNEFSAIGDGPILDVSREPIGVIENKRSELLHRLAISLLGKIGCANERGDDGGNG